MASAKRKQKQEEKNLTVLRVLASQPGNKECFDCHQRGPTYVNMTIGSFVCTSCSGMLRGLTPPHRVKSISMATFTQEEIDFIMERGNDYCRRVWLGLMNANQMPTMDTKDEQKMRDLMRAKYELKTYYLDPSKAGINQNSSQKSQIGLSSSSSSSSPSLSNQLVNPTPSIPTTTIPKVPYSTFGSTALTTTTILPAPTNQKSKNNPENALNANNFTADFVADFSKVPDPFVSPTTTPCSKTMTSHHQSIIPEPFFANFDNNPAFNDSPKGTATMLPYNNTMGGNMNINGTTTSTAPAPPSEDRYAALKDLDSLMKQTQLKDDTATTSPATAWNANNSIALNSVWGTNNATNQNAHVISNPFTSGDLWRPSANIVNNNNTQPIMSNVYHHPPNPFKQMQFPLNNDSQWMGLGTPNNGDDFSKLMTPLPNKVWQPTVSAYHANPFMVGSGLSNMTRNSNNPFL